MKARVPTFIAVVSAAVVFTIPRLALAQTPTHDHTPPSTVSNPSAPAPPAPSESTSGMKMQDMKMAGMKMGEKNVEAMKAAKERIDGLMTRLKATEGAARVDVLTELVTALVERHETMCQEMMSGHAGR